jgi:Tol biopolymer transport system component
VSYVGTEMEGQFWTVPIPTGTPRHLADVVGHDGTWSRDGRLLAFGKGSEIFVANANGTNPRRLSTVAGRADGLRFSPDGTRLRFTLGTQESPSASIWEVHVDGSGLQPLLPNWHTSPAECCGEWSSDGRYYFFVGSFSGTSNLFALRERTGLFTSQSGPFQLTTGPLSLPFFVPSPDNKKIFADGYSPRGELVRYDNQSHQFLPFFSGISAGEMDFSRDGKWVAYVSYPDKSLWRARIDGSERLQLAPPYAFLPRWSPDGTQIAYTDQSGRPWKVFLISMQGGTPQEIFAESQHQGDPSWSPDGKQLVFGRVGWLTASLEKIAIRVLDLNSKQVSTIPGSDGLYSPRWSPDGKHLAALSSDSKKLLLFDFRTQKWTDWINEPGFIGFPSWSRDAKYVYYDYYATTSTERNSFRRVKVGQTRSEFLIDLRDLHRYRGSSWSGLTPDDSALFIRDLSTDEIYSLEVELP